MARPMGLDYKPKTPAAVAFCDALGKALSANETDRKYQRQGDRKRHFNLAAGAIAAELLKAARTELDRWSWRVCSPANFTDASVTYTDFRRVLEASEKAELIERLRGHYQRYDFGGGVVAGKGQASRFRALPKLIAFAAEHGVTRENLDDHFERKVPELPPKPLVLRGSSTRLGHRKFKGQGLRFDRTEQTDRLEQDIRDLNKFLAQHEISGGIHRGYRRIFNQGDRTPYRWNKGGRLYSIGEDSYQTLKKDKRLLMTLDGEPVVEIDIRASYLTLLHGLKGVSFDPAERDPYKVGRLPRAVVKAWVTMTIGHTEFHRRWPKQTVEALRENGEEPIDTKDYPMREITSVILRALPILRDWPTQSLTGFDLMYMESEAVIGTMLDLMREHQVPSLSVHDSIIVPVGRGTEASSILSERYRAVCGIRPYLQTRIPPQWDF